MAEAEECVLELRGVTKSYPGVRALRDISLSVRSNEIHCLVGENGSGKSTLIRCMSGVETPDRGEVIIRGERQTNLTAYHAMTKGIQVIYQDLSLFPDLSVAENIAFTWSTVHSHPFVTATGWRSVARRALDRLQLDLDLDATVQDLPMSEKQIVAIARSIILDAKLLVLDEPTTALTKKEIERLLSIIIDLKRQGIATIFVSHKLDEIFRVADKITVLRDGQKIGDFEADELDERKLAYHMTGRSIMYPTFNPSIKDGEKILEVRHLTRRPHFEDITFDIREGEIVGLIGPLGAGRTELALSLFGLNRPHAGQVLFRGKPVNVTSPRRARNLGIALLPEDRRWQGLFPTHSIADNIVASILDKLRRFFILQNWKLRDTSLEWFSSLRIKAPSVETQAQALSGGNQQRVVLGKWLATNPRLFIMDSPTVGIDIGSKSEIYEIVQDLAAKGKAILLISDEIPEVYHNSNRIIVMREGRITTIVDARSTTEDALHELVEGKVEA